MKRLLSFISLSLLFCTLSFGQELNPKFDRDSLFNVLVKKIPEAKRQEFKDGYKTASIKEKDFYIFMLNMPQSSKEALINNISKKKPQINNLISNYNALVPKDYTVYVEFTPADSLFDIPESVDLHVTQKGKETETGHTLAYGSAELNSKLQKLGWNNQTLEKIKKLLADAGCISIENNDVTVVGFARSGLAKYGFLVFPKPLNFKEISEYNDGCHYLYHENNLVLTFGGGAIGPDCFPE